MPELPEVETTKASLAPLLGQRVQQVSIYQSSLRWPIPHDLSRLQGQTLQFLNRRAKYIVARFEKDALLMHLGMSGSFALLPASDTRRKHDHLCIDFENIQLRYHDPRRFGSILWLHEPRAQSLLASLGVEPLDAAFHAEHLAAKLKNKQTAIKVAIMDNAVVVGVGNIYATEALFHTGIHPARPAASLTFDEISRLVKKGGDIGKRLDFLIQELHREANTLGSKSAALDLTRISVDMKVLIEQMREQVQNIE